MAGELTNEERRHRAKEAKRLRSEPLFREALTRVRTEALEALAGVDPTNADDVRRLQAVVIVVDKLDGELFALEVDTDETQGASPEGEADIR